MIVGGIGTIEKRAPNTWRIRLSIGRDPLTGKYRQKSRTVRGTKADAFREREVMRRELEQGIRFDAERMTFVEYAQEYLQRRQLKGAYKSVTLAGDRMHIRRLSKYLGGLRLKQIDASVLSVMQKQMLDDGYSNTMMHSTIGKLRQMLKEAVRLDFIPSNPCDKIDIPQANIHEMVALDAKGAQRLTHALEQHERLVNSDMSITVSRSLIEQARITGTHLALCTGMRRGEILGLTWSHIDFEKRSIQINQQLTANREIREPKTRSGIRSISIDPAITKRLAKWKTNQDSLLQKLKIEASCNTPIVANSVGEFSDASDFTLWWSTFRRRYGFEGLRFHDLRHTQATLLIGNGVDIKTVQSRLGHSRAATTLDIYASALPENDRKAADLFGSLIGNEQKS